MRATVVQVRCTRALGPSAGGGSGRGQGACEAGGVLLHMGCSLQRTRHAAARAPPLQPPPTSDHPMCEPHTPRWTAHATASAWRSSSRCAAAAPGPPTSPRCSGAVRAARGGGSRRPSIAAASRPALPVPRQALPYLHLGPVPTSAPTARPSPLAHLPGPLQRPGGRGPPGRWRRRRLGRRLPAGQRRCASPGCNTLVCVRVQLLRVSAFHRHLTPSVPRPPPPHQTRRSAGPGARAQGLRPAAGPGGARRRCGAGGAPPGERGCGSGAGLGPAAHRQVGDGGRRAQLQARHQAGAERAAGGRSCGLDTAGWVGRTSRVSLA